MPLYNELPGMDITVNDGGIQIPIDPTTGESILIIAPNGSGTAYSGGGNVVAPVKIESQSSFGSTELGSFGTSNELAKLWRQVYDAGCRNIYASPLYGTTTVQQYEYLHDLYTVLEDQIAQDIVLLGGVYADSTLASSPQLVKYTTREDFAAAIQVANSRTTSVTSESVQVGDDSTVDVALDNPMVTSVVLTDVEVGQDGIFESGSLTAIGDDNSTGITMVFAGCTATLYSDATPVAAEAQTATTGTETIANSATPASTAQGFVNIFNAIKLEASSPIATFTFELDTDSVKITIPKVVAESYNESEITGTATFANTGNANQLTQEGEADVETALAETAYELVSMTGAITLDTAIATGHTLYADYEYYTTDFAAQLSGFCEVVASKNAQIISFMALSMPSSTTDLSVIKAYVDSYVDSSNLAYSKLLTIAGGAPCVFSLGSNVYESMIHGALAGVASVSPSFISPTHSNIPGVLYGAYTLSKAQLLNLTNKHIVCPRKYKGRIVFGDVITTADDDSDFVRLSTVRIVDEVIDRIQDIGDQYIGKPNDLKYRNAFHTQVGEALGELVDLGALNDFAYNVKATLSQQIDGQMYVYVDLVPKFETRHIVVAISVKAALD